LFDADRASRSPRFAAILVRYFLHQYTTPLNYDHRMFLFKGRNVYTYDRVKETAEDDEAVDQINNLALTQKVQTVFFKSSALGLS
jgi:hypothetical protein